MFRLFQFLSQREPRNHIETSRSSPDHVGEFPDLFEPREASPKPMFTKSPMIPDLLSSDLSHELAFLQKELLVAISENDLRYRAFIEAKQEVDAGRMAPKDMELVEEHLESERFAEFEALIFKFAEIIANMEGKSVEIMKTVIRDLRDGNSFPWCFQAVESLLESCRNRVVKVIKILKPDF